MAKYRIAVIPGDGIGKEVIPESMRVLERSPRPLRLARKWDELDWGCES